MVGVSAIRQDGSVPAYSNRDAIFVDMAAPGDNIFSTIPQSLVDVRAAPTVPYSDCGPTEFRDAIGTSFAAPQVSAAAALILGQDPSLRPDQVTWLLERSAADESAANGCTLCPPGRDALTGWGRLDVQAALTDLTTGTPLPPPDRYEPNDDAGSFAHAAAAAAAHDLGDARLLGRPDRRLPRRAEEGAAPVRPPHTAGGGRRPGSPSGGPEPSASKASTSI